MAASDNVVSGKYGCAKVGAADGLVADAESLLEVTAWQYNEQIQDSTYASCESDGNRRRVDGAYDITGTTTVVYNASAPFRATVKPGDNVIWYLFKRKAMAGVTGLYDRIPAKILGLSGGVNIDQGGVQQWEISWALNETTEDPAATFDNVADALAT